MPAIACAPDTYLADADFQKKKKSSDTSCGMSQTFLEFLD